jgi:tetratricopeptide (TPR) repeat protein
MTTYFKGKVIMKHTSPWRRARSFSIQFLLVTAFLLSLPVRPCFAQALPPGTPDYDLMNEIARLREKILKNPDDIKAWFQLGRRFEQRKEWDEAIHAYETVIRKKTAYVDAWKWLGWAYARVNNDAEALKVFDELTAIPSHAADAYAGMGWIYYTQGQYTKAVESYKQALQARPNFAGAIYEIARTHMAMKDREAAHAQHTTLTKLDPLLAKFLQGEITRAENWALADVAAAAHNTAPQPVTLDDSFSKKPYLMIYEKTKLPASIKSCGMNGEVKLSVLINPDGNAGDIRPISELPFGLTEIAIEAVEKFQFQPAIKLGKPVPVRIIFTYTFWLD